MRVHCTYNRVCSYNAEVLHVVQVNLFFQALLLGVLVTSVCDLSYTIYQEVSTDQKVADYLFFSPSLLIASVVRMCVCNWGGGGGGGGGGGTLTGSSKGIHSRDQTGFLLLLETECTNNALAFFFFWGGGGVCINFCTML